MVSKPLKSFAQYTPTIALFYVSLKLVTSFENAFLNPPHNSPLRDWSILSSVGPSLAAWKMRRIRQSQAAFGIILQDYRLTAGFLYAFSWSKGRFRVSEEGS